ncbi:MAG: hypothetical protein O7F09_03600 [Chloroflexi bacterium]|nr:hypothetical protein [Chloroflexota bacterium]
MRNGLGVLNIWINALAWSLVAPVILFWGVRFLIIAGSPVSILGLLGGLLTLGGLAILWFFAATAWLDLLSKRIEVAGRVYRKWTVTTPSYSSQIIASSALRPGYRTVPSTISTYHIAILDQELEVSERIYNWLSEGEDVVVSYWPRSKVVSRVDKESES